MALIALVSFRQVVLCISVDVSQDYSQVENVIKQVRGWADCSESMCLLLFSPFLWVVGNRYILLAGSVVV